MGCADVFCIICGMPYTNWFMEEQGKSKETKWLDDCTFLTLDDKVISNCINHDCYAGFKIKDGSLEFELYGYFQEDNISDYSKILGSSLHTACWKFIEKEYGIKLIYSMIPFLKIYGGRRISYSHPPCLYHINYGEVEKYWAQMFDFEQLIKDGNEYMYQSPLINKKNAQRIKKIISQMKLKKEQRQGPQISATWYPDSIYRMGNNNMIWITKNNKWNEIKINPTMIKLFVSFKNRKDTIKDIKKLYSIINKIKQIGQCSTSPIFIDNLYKTFDYNTKVTYVKVTIISINGLNEKVLENIKKLKKIKLEEK